MKYEMMVLALNNQLLLVVFFSKEALPFLWDNDASCTRSYLLHVHMVPPPRLERPGHAVSDDVSVT